METPSSRRKPQKKVRREAQTRRKSSWCCSFKSPPKSPESISVSSNKPARKPTFEYLSKHVTSFPNSPQSAKSALGLVGRIGTRRILSPGRVSPIDSEPTAEMSPEPARISNLASSVLESDEVPTAAGQTQSLNLGDEEQQGRGGGGGGGGGGVGVFDVRLNLKGKRGGCLALELNSEVLRENSPIFADLISDCGKNNLGMNNLFRIEVPEVENLGVFRETIELMFEDDITKRLLKIGAYRAIDVLEVSASIKFSRCISSCLKYLEAVPWTEEEEEKLKRLFIKFKFNDKTTREILARLEFQDSVVPQPNLPRQLVWSVTACSNAKARNELKSLVKGLFCQSSIYQKDHLDISKDDLYAISCSCLSSLITLFKEACNTGTHEQADNKDPDRPLVESISWQVDNITWLLEILLERQIAEEFVETWADQKELIRMHGLTSPMVRYELSRVTAALLIAMGTRKLHCHAESRVGLLQSWFGTMLLDFGWLQRCRKGLDIRQLEEAMGQALLTLPLKQQHELFMEWFRCFSKHGTECPNISKAFQVWWRRTFSRGSETHDVELR
ncbi:hypothetical protein Nepgr_001659 [Nepenthes gracilis]|uniref:At3g05675-like ankyrin-like domain-containing protein n=1 Tax=Nepenthes gracilis TaxID=150966 RepID=A0AAD3P2Y2_NEPGR|nr:hypothetical protein Nepgr_001659 [Nepenthes gracilis]